MKHIKYLGLFILLIVDNIACGRNIVDYARVGDLAKVQKCIKNGDDIDLRDNTGYKAWDRILIGEAGLVEKIKYLIKNRGDTETYYEYSCDTSLQVASRYEHTKIVKYLVENGA